MENNKPKPQNTANNNQSESHYTDMQVTVPALVVATGYAPDGEYYAQAITQNPVTGDQNLAYIRFSDMGELANSYTDLYKNTTKELSEDKARQDAKAIMINRAGKRDLKQLFLNKAEQAQRHGQFEGMSLESIVDKNSDGAVLMLSGITVLGETKNNDLLSEQSLSASESPALLVAANSISIASVFKEKNHFFNPNLADEYSPVATTPDRLEQAFVRIKFDPQKHEAEAYKILPNPATINFDQIKKNPAPLLNAISENTNPTSNALPSASRQGHMELGVNYISPSGKKVSHRLELPSNHMVGGEHFNKSAEEYLELSHIRANGGAEKEITRFMAGKDVSSSAKNPDMDVLAKNDIVRFAIAAATQPNFIGDFAKKRKEGDLTAFHGVTKFDYLSQPKDMMTPTQQMVLDFTDSVVSDPHHTFLSTTNYEKLNLPVEVKKTLSEHVKGSIIKATKGTNNNLVGQTAAALTARTNSMLDVASRNDYDNQGVNITVIPAFIATTTVPSEASIIDNSSPNKQDGLAIHGVQSDIFHPLLKTVVAPIMREQGTLHNKSLTFYANAPAPNALVNSMSKEIGFDRARFNIPKVLIGQDLTEGFKPDIDGTDFTAKFNYKQSDLPKNERLGFISVANKNILSEAPSGDLNFSAKQLLLLPGILCQKKTFKTVAEANPQNTATANTRYAEFQKAIGELVGPLSKENNTLSNLRTALNTKDLDSLSVGHRKIHDMLLTDKLVEVGDANDKNKGENKKNFSDLAKLALYPRGKMDEAIKADVNGNQIKVQTQDVSKYKAHRTEQGLKQAVEQLTNPANHKTADDIVKEAMEATKPKRAEPANTPTVRF